MWASITADCKGSPELGDFLESCLSPNFLPLRHGGSDIHLGPPLTALPRQSAFRQMSQDTGRVDSH